MQVKPEACMEGDKWRPHLQRREGLDGLVDILEVCCGVFGPV